MNNDHNQAISLEWLDKEGWEMLNNCFEWEVEEMPAGSEKTINGKVGWVLSGTGSFLAEKTNSDSVESEFKNISAAAEKKAISPGVFLGVAKSATGDRMPQNGTFTANSLCRIAWFDYDLLCFACYRGCWFHARIMREVDDALNSPPLA